jgi:hypothetical protein
MLNDLPNPVTSPRFGLLHVDGQFIGHFHLETVREVDVRTGTVHERGMVPFVRGVWGDSIQLEAVTGRKYEYRTT